MQLKIIYSDKTLTAKPTTNYEKAKYFKDITFTTTTIELTQFKSFIESGRTLTYLFNDDTFKRENSYMKNNYQGTQYICVDIDESPYDLNTLILTTKYKPTFAHTTFSNKTACKGFKWCFHLYYVFDSIIFS